MEETFYAHATVTILGVEFHGVEEMIQYALACKPKDGVWVGEDSDSYPCFDSSDYACEDRSYWNFVFARSRQELAAKLDALRGMSPLAGNYCKLTDRLHPMAYWGGDTHSLLELSCERPEAVRLCTRGETVEICKGVRFVEIFPLNQVFYKAACFVALDTPKVSRNKEGQRVYSWRGQDEKTGEIVSFLVTEGAEHYGPTLYLADSESFARIKHFILHSV